MPDGPPSSNDLRRNWRNQGRRTGIQQTRFTGVCEDLKDYVYDTGVGRNNAEIFSKTTKAIAEYVAREYTAAGEFRNGLPDLTLPTLTAPTPPQPHQLWWSSRYGKWISRSIVNEWKRERRTWRRRMPSSCDNAPRRFAIGSKHTSNGNRSTLLPMHWAFYA